MVRQHLDSGGFYEPDTHRMREVKNVTYVTTVNPMTPACVPPLSQRLMRHFAILGMPYPKYVKSRLISLFINNQKLLNRYQTIPLLCIWNPPSRVVWPFPFARAEVRELRLDPEWHPSVLVVGSNVCATTY